MALITFGTVQTLDSFTYSGESTFSLAVRYLYSTDLNGDGLDELVFAGFETQLNTPENYTNTKLAVYGWQNGIFTNQTNQWLPNGTNALEGVGDIGFGDFNGDGRVDLYLSAYTDMEHPVNAYALMNQGTYFEKVNHGQAIWQHGVAVADINNDGFSDVFATGYDQPAIYLGSPSGLIQQAMGPNRFMGGGSGVALADFIGDGNISMITVDGWIDGVFDTGLYGFGPNLELTLLSVLPQSRMGIVGHDIRVRAFDFSHDGLMDAIVFTRAGFDGTYWPTSSEIQFLENQGNGTFWDVTSSRLTSFERASNVSYAPYFVDINRDGLIDIFLSEASWDQNHQSTTILLAQQDGSYIDTGRDELSAYVEDQGGMAGLVRGPNNQFHLVTESHQFGSGNATVKAVALYFPERDDAEFLSGTMLGDLIYGLGGDDAIQGLAGDDTLDGGQGLDASVYVGNSSQYSFAIGPTSSLVVDNIIDRDGTDGLISIERLQFADINLALDINGTAGQAYRIYEAVLGRAPDLEGLGYWINDMDNGVSLTTIAQGFIASPEFQGKYGANPSYETYLNLLYNNILERAPDTDGMNYWMSNMRNGIDSPAAVLASFSEGYENTANVAPDIANGIYYTAWIT